MLSKTTYIHKTCEPQCFGIVRKCPLKAYGLKIGSQWKVQNWKFWDGINHEGSALIHWQMYNLMRLLGDDVNVEMKHGRKKPVPEEEASPREWAFKGDICHSLCLTQAQNWIFTLFPLSPVIIVLVCCSPIVLTAFFIPFSALYLLLFLFQNSNVLPLSSTIVPSTGWSWMLKLSVELFPPMTLFSVPRISNFVVSLFLFCVTFAYLFLGCCPMCMYINM